MEIKLSSSPFTSLAPEDTLALLCTAEALREDPALLELDHAHDGYISKIVEREGFKATWDKVHVLRMAPPGPGLVLLIGLDEGLLPTGLQLRQAGGLALERAKSHGAKKLTISLIGRLPKESSRSTVTRFLTEGALLSAHQRFTHKKKTENREDIDLLILSWPGQDTLVLEQSVSRAQLVAKAINTARDLVNEPAGTLTPSSLADKVAGFAGVGMEVKKHGPEWLKNKGMGGILGVGAGSAVEPRLIEVSYTPSQSDMGELLLVGKGVTFDSGGLSLKPGDSMKTMKHDMAGAAVLAGISAILSELAPNRPIRILLAAAENMPSGSAVKLGDVLHMYDGKTVEVMNTDAEGRLVLADALAYGTEYGPEAAIDVATLTGASVMALGRLCAAVMGSSEELVKNILSSSEHAGELIWQLPLIPFYKKQLETKMADMKNVGERWGGAITAGLFLSEFVGETPWAHLDIAGPSWIDKAQPAFPEGGTGFGVGTLVELISPMAD